MLRSLLIGLIDLYKRWLSPLLGPRCRFHPSCSSYARQALSQHGLLRGGWMAAVRILRCSPLSSGGLDPVPARFHWWPSPAQEDHGCTHDHHKDPQ
ncbi:MAG: membrane protein insertion efficiency factor YidD [Xanthomonadales bacterium]|nr:membrane protein insertion efficiency factor YidD [Xanthomonadales bacterium]